VSALERDTFLIRWCEISPTWLGMYAVTFALQIPCALIRQGVCSAVLWVGLKLLGHSTSFVSTLVLLVGFVPLALSLGMLVLPWHGWWWEQQYGGRAPSERERLLFEEAMARLREVDQGLRGPRRWFVLDVSTVNAAAYADTLMLSRGLLEHGPVDALLAHELGHLNSSDGRLGAALRCLTLTPPAGVRHGLKTIVFFASGEAGMRAVHGMWSSYWRVREHEADRYAANLGQAAALSEFLKTTVLQADVPVPYIWMTEHTHPPVEHRIEQLNHHPSPRAASEEAGVAVGSEPVKGAPPGPPSAGPDGPPLTEPDPTTERSIRSAKPTPAEPQSSTSLDAGETASTVTVIPKPGRGRTRNGSDDHIRWALTPLIDAKAASTLLGVPYTWLLSQAREGKIPHQRLGHYVRFNPEDLANWIAENRIEPHGIEARPR
jgi:Zn-dependent protease with chaperone function